jgi:hypothetical protein
MGQVAGNITIATPITSLWYSQLTSMRLFAVRPGPTSRGFSVVNDLLSVSKAADQDAVC